VIRFIMVKDTKDQHSGAEFCEWYTIDANVIELELALTAGGRGEYGYEMHRLVGAEVRDWEGKK